MWMSMMNALDTRMLRGYVIPDRSLAASYEELTANRAAALAQEGAAERTVAVIQRDLERLIQRDVIDRLNRETADWLVKQAVETLVKAAWKLCASIKDQRKRRRFHRYIRWAVRERRARGDRWKK